MTMESAVFDDEFLNDAMHQTRWKAFLKKKKALIQVSMDEAMARIKLFVSPLLEDASPGVNSWKPETSHWE